MNLSRVGWAEYVACMEKMTYKCKVFVGKPEGKRLLKKLRYGRKNNISIDFK
jgi:hypothetical protein